MDESKESLKGQPRRWDAVCVAGKSWKDVQKVFRSAGAAPELALVELGKLHGLDVSSFYPEHVDPEGPDVLRLRFRKRPRRPVAASSKRCPRCGRIPITRGISR